VTGAGPLERDQESLSQVMMRALGSSSVAQMRAYVSEIRNTGFSGGAYDFRHAKFK
jgi:hypothetical protein